MTDYQQNPDIHNECGGCTLCCYLPRVPTLGKKACVLCPHCSATGCMIYKSKPQECSDFKCAYRQMQKVSTSLSPDKCKMMFEKISDDVFLGTQDPRFGMTDVARLQIQQFNGQGYSVVVVTKSKDCQFFISPQHTPEGIRRKFEEHLKMQR